MNLQRKLVLVEGDETLEVSDVPGHEVMLTITGADGEAIGISLCGDSVDFLRAFIGVADERSP